MAHRQSHGTIHSEAREVIANIIEKCDVEEPSKHLVLPLPKATASAAVYAGVSYATVKNIRKGDKKRKENDANRNEVYNFYIQEKRVPTIPKLLPLIKSKISFLREKHLCAELLKAWSFDGGNIVKSQNFDRKTVHCELAK
jgi:hypothetical protein